MSLFNILVLQFLILIHLLLLLLNDIVRHAICFYERYIDSSVRVIEKFSVFRVLLDLLADMRVDRVRCDIRNAFHHLSSPRRYLLQRGGGLAASEVHGRLYGVVD